MDIPTLFSAFITQVGARHLSFDFTDAQRKMLSHPVMQTLILYGMFILATRSLTIATIMLIAYFLLIFVFFNEKHPFNLFSKNWLSSEGFDAIGVASAKEHYLENLSKLGVKFAS